MKIIEASTGFNWGKFGIIRFTSEDWAHRSAIDGRSVLAGRGWCEDHLLVVDLQTGEGARFRPAPGEAKHQLERHQVWVCPLFEPFLEWLFEQDLEDLSKLPNLVEFPLEEVGGAMYGYRRPGPRVTA